MGRGDDSDFVILGHQIGKVGHGLRPSPTVHEQERAAVSSLGNREFDWAEISDVKGVGAGCSFSGGCHINNLIPVP